MKKCSSALLIMLRVAMVIVGAYYFYMFVSPIFGIIFNIGSVLGAFLSAVLIILGLFLNKIAALLKKCFKNKPLKIILITLITGFCICVVLILSAVFSITLSDDTKTDNQQTIIVLGCSVRGDTPSVTLNSRINAAYDYLEANPQSVAVLSGGQGPDENISEAQCMFNVLTEKGIDPERLYLEDKSVNTNTNIENSKKVIEENGLSKNVAVASSDYHLKRAVMICEKSGFENVGRISAPSTYIDKPTFYLREALGVLKELIVR